MWYFETQSKASANKLKWHDTLALLDVELIHKPRWDNIIPNALSRKEEFQLEKPLIKTQALRAIFKGKNTLEWNIRKTYVQDPLAQCYFKELHE